MISGIGVDSIEISRVIKAIEKQHFLNSIYTDKERKEIDSHPRRSASNFAGKEAVVKMFGTGFGKIRANEIEILREENGKPFVTLYGEAKKFANENHIKDIYISITNTKEIVTAFVIGTCECGEVSFV